MANVVRVADSRDAASQPSAFAWDPLQIMRDLTGVDPFRDFERGRVFGRAWNPAFDVKETAQGFVITADVPGLAEEDLDVQLSGNRLTISGRRATEQRKEGESFVSVERSQGSFSRSWTLPDSIASDRIVADLRQGVLTLELPKRPEVTPRKISVRSVVDGLKAAVTGGKDRQD